MAASRNKRIPARAKSQRKGKEINTEMQPVFHLFPKLPIELRLKIWRLDAPEPCVVTQLEGYGYKPLHTTMVARPTPAVLHVCRESRNEFLCRNNDAVSLNIERPLYRPFFQDGLGKRIFFSFEQDALHLMSIRAAEPLVKKELRHLVIGTPQPPANTNLFDLMTATQVPRQYFDNHFWAGNYSGLKRFKKLETLIVLTHTAGPHLSLPSKEAILTLLNSFKKQNPEYNVPKVILKVLHKPMLTTDSSVCVFNF